MTVILKGQKWPAGPSNNSECFMCNCKVIHTDCMEYGNGAIFLCAFCAADESFLRGFVADVLQLKAQHHFNTSERHNVVLVRKQRSDVGDLT